jgi:hypothetical protein
MIFGVCSAAHAWTNHAVLTYMALDSMPDAKNRVRAETIESFLNMEREKIGKALEAEETWARENVRDYQPRPDALAFSASREKDIVVRFLNAVRLNPRMKFPLFLQPRDPKDARRRAGWDTISLYPRNYLERPLVSIRPGELVAVEEVVATASDEPDYGYDFGLYENNETTYGSMYGYGPQPISDPKIFSYTQAGFHMGFYHESWIVFKAAPILKRTCPEQRAHLLYALSRFAFETGHPYWGYRFAGMGMHYVQDLAQPFHACTLPGVSTIKLLWISVLNAIGFNGPYDRAVAKVTNEHTLLETLLYDVMREKFDGAEHGDPLLTALGDAAGDAAPGTYDGHYITSTVSREAYERADDLITALNGIISDRELFGRAAALDREGRLNPRDVVSASSEPDKKRFNGAMTVLMKSIGEHSRAYLRAATAR